jgi:hypothetical protein
MPRFFGAVEAVLGSEQRNQIAVLAQQNPGANTFSINAGLIRNQSNPFSLQDRVVALFKNDDAEIDDSGCARSEGKKAKRKNER